MLKSREKVNGIIDTKIIDHVIVVVTNCCLKSLAHLQDEELCDQIPIKIHAQIMEN